MPRAELKVSVPAEVPTTLASSGQAPKVLQQGRTRRPRKELEEVQTMPEPIIMRPYILGNTDVRDRNVYDTTLDNFCIGP